MKARRASQGFALSAAADCWWYNPPPPQIKGGIIIIIPAGKEDPGGTPELCKRVRRGGNSPAESEGQNLEPSESHSCYQRNVPVQTHTEIWRG